MNELVDCFSEPLMKNGCDIDKIIPEWDLLKLEVSCFFWLQEDEIPSSLGEDI